MGSISPSQPTTTADEPTTANSHSSYHPHSSPKPLKVAIIGGGPGGLATAIALLNSTLNTTVHIYEKDAILREVGAGINIGPNSWNVLQLLGVADSLASGHQSNLVLNLNGRTGEELHRNSRSRPGSEGWPDKGKKWTTRPTIRTQRTKLQSALLEHVPEGVIKLGKKLERIVNLDADGNEEKAAEKGTEGGAGGKGVELIFTDGTRETADLVVGADGIRSVVRDSAWSDYQISFTGTTIWRALLPLEDLTSLDERFGITAWWHLPTSHVYFSPVGEGLGEIAAREYQDPKVHSASKVVWGVPVGNEYVEGHFKDYLPQIRTALSRIAPGAWREFAAFAGPELAQLTTWNNKVILVGDSSHALSGAFGSGAGFAMEDGWVLAQALRRYGNDTSRALPLFDRIRVPYYSRMYEYLGGQGKLRAEKLEKLERDIVTKEGESEEEVERRKEEEKVKIKVIKEGGDMSWIYQNHIGRVWEAAVAELNDFTLA